MNDIACSQQITSGLDLSSPEAIALAAQMGFVPRPLPSSGKAYDILGTEWQVVTGVPQDWMLGHMDAMASQIRIKPGIPDSWRLYILLHETLHGLTFLGHLQFLREEPSDDCVTARDDEARVDAVASLLATVLRRNGLINEEKLAQLCCGD